MYQNYIFDLYGTLVDIHTNERKLSLWKKMAMAYSLQGAAYTAQKLKKRYGELAVAKEEIEISLYEVFRQLFLEGGVDPSPCQVSDMGIFFRTLSLEELRLFEGAYDLLDRLRKGGKKIYLLSNAQRMFTEPEMRMLGIYHSFDGVMYSSDVGFKKPSLHFYGALFEKYGLIKKNSVMIGNDSEADIAGAHRFGIASMYLHTRQSPALTGKLPDDCRRLQEIGSVEKKDKLSCALNRS